MTSRPAERFVASFFTLSGAGFGEPPRHGFPERVRAAAAVGYDGIGIHLNELQDPKWNPWGLSDPELVLRRMQDALTGTGLDVVEYEFLDGWLDGESAGLEENLALLRRAVDLLATGTVGGHHVSAGVFASGDSADPATAARGLSSVFRGLSGDIGDIPLAVAVEAFPWSRLPNYDLVTEVLRDPELSDPDINIGLLVDLWHFINTGSNPEDLRSGRLGPVSAVQLNGGQLVHDNFLVQARSGRQLPGEGSLPGTAIIQALHDTGFQGPWCVESNTPQLRKLPVENLAKVSIEAARNTFSRALSIKEIS